MVRIDVLPFLINLPLHVMAPLINEEAVSGNIAIGSIAMPHFSLVHCADLFMHLLQLA